MTYNVFAGTLNLLNSMHGHLGMLSAHPPVRCALFTGGWRIYTAGTAPVTSKTVIRDASIPLMSATPVVVFVPLQCKAFDLQYHVTYVFLKCWDLHLRLII